MTPPTPQASVIIPLYNKKPWFRDCLLSVVANAEHTPLDGVIVDDGSTDGSLDTVRDVLATNPWIRVISQANAGVSAARNTAIHAALCERLLFLDADDVWFPQHAQSLINTWNQWPEATLVFSTPKELIDGQTIDDRSKGRPKNPGPVVDLLHSTRQGGTLLNTSTIGLHKRVWTACGGFRENAVSGEDFLMWAEAFVRGPVVWTGQTTGTRHLHTENNITLNAMSLGGLLSEDLWPDMLQTWIEQNVLPRTPAGQAMWTSACQHYFWICQIYRKHPDPEALPTHPFDTTGWTA